MCLIAFAIDADPACPLLIAANRDEFFDRPTAALHRWTLPDGTGVVAGRDLRDGGTWLGVSESGRVAMLTNVRSAQPGPGARSRGELATRWLQGQQACDELRSAIDPAAYGGFNLVVGDVHLGGWAWLSNRHPERPHDDRTVALHQRALLPGLYGLSNAALDTPWPKTQRLKQAVSRSLAQQQKGNDRWLQPLTETLADGAPAGAHEQPSTGVPADVERALSSPFVNMAERGYGTRSSLVLRVCAVGAGRQMELHEWTHAPSLAADQGHRWNPGSRVSHHLRW